MSELKYEDLTYIGKDYNGEGSFTDKKTGEVKLYKKYTYKFKKNMDDQWDRKFYGFDNTKGADSLEEGNVYRIGYTVFQNNHGTESKSAKFFSSDTSTPIKESSSDNQRAVVQEQPRMIDYKQHLTEYLVDRKNPSANGFAIYVLNKEYSEVVKTARDAFDSSVQQPVEELVE